MPIPSLQLQKKTCLMQRSRGFGHGVAVSKICYNAVIVLSVVLCDCCRPNNSCRDWVFSNSGLEAKLPVLQLPMFAKCDALPKGDLLLDTFKDISLLEFQACTPNSRYSLLQRHSSCRCSQNVMHCRKEICWTCLFQEFIPAIPLGNAMHPLPTRSLRLLRAPAHFASSALCLQKIPSLRCSCRKSPSSAEKQRVW